MKLPQGAKRLIQLRIDAYHVGTDITEILQECFYCHPTFRATPSATRQAVVKYAEKRHEQNRNLYNRVMSGRL